PEPAGGFPAHDLSDPEQLLWGLSRDFVHDLWNEPENTAVLVQVYLTHYPTAAQVRTITNAIAMITRVVTGEASFRVLPPEPVRDAQGNRLTSPTTWAIVRLSPPGAHRMVLGRVFSSAELSIMVYPRAISFPDFLVSLGGFTEDHGGEILEAIWAIFNGPRILPLILQYTRVNPIYATYTPEAAAAAIISSLRVSVQTMENGNVVATVYCQSPTSSVHSWRRWRDAVAQVPFRSFFNRTGIARAPSICEGCHGASHPTHLCPYPSLPSWNG
ncbi:hypothetical protein C2E23DRAFT_686267, partial [Lenzites betulinus]